MAAEKESKYNEENDEEDTDEELNDGYAYVKNKNNLLASSEKGMKQNSQKYEIKDLVKASNMDVIHQCIGQITIDNGQKNDKGDPVYRYGTGTIYKKLDDKYYLIITCAHNMTHFNDKLNVNKLAEKLFFLPKGMQDQTVRLKCIKWNPHPDYNARIDHCGNDIGIILAYDAVKHYKKK
eukprot:56926_1